MYCGIQFGHRMKNAAMDLCELWGDGSIMLGPRNFPPTKYKASSESLIDYAERLKGCAQNVYIDPQLFSCANPAKHLRNFSYWQACKGDLKKNSKQVIEKLAALNGSCATRAMVLPATTADRIDDSWRETQSTLLEAAGNYRNPDDLIVSVALTADVLKDDQSIDAICLAAAKWSATGVYVVCERPKDYYLTDDPLWVLNLMLLVAGLKFAGKKVFVGYSSHQQLLLTLTKCDAIFSGNYLNMRRFRTSDFGNQGDRGPSRHATWYYAPQTLSEYRVVTLDLAFQQGILDKLAPPFDDSFAGVMFKGARPSNTAYNETASFLHYLTSLHAQCEQFSRETYLATFDFYSSYLQTAEKAIEGLHKQGVFDPARSFRDILAANASAINAFNSTLGYKMGQRWNDL